MTRLGSETQTSHAIKYRSIFHFVLSMHLLYLIYFENAEGANTAPRRWMRAMATVPEVI